ncbi:DUF483 domain-containing protein [Candidatus Woesearchaeota archaeon]|nr:DUF483 domain-containing protein [Candidatus Woesearchaeota archaeon]MBT6520193.1 DUF483 domain-containing protein [Candidatus Woesearchaeota archaeon]MBT7367181.1 DUF483 domain-containing protein [Candidatus Woesearchaeota archaeon]
MVDFKKAFDILFFLLNSNLSVLDILYVLNDLKPCCRITLSQDKLILLKNFCDKNKLELGLSDYKVVPVSNRNFSESYKRVPLNFEINTKGSFHVYISKDQEIIEKAKQFQNEKNSSAFGKLLGYPSCCCNFFSNNESEARLSNMDFTFFYSLSNQFFNFYNNYSLRSFDISLLSHFPCSLDCPNSLRIAKERSSFIKTFNPDLASSFEKHLKSCVFYTDSGIYYSSDFSSNLFSSITSLEYNNLFSKSINSNNNSIFDFLQNNKNQKLNLKDFSQEFDIIAKENSKQKNCSRIFLFN